MIACDRRSEWASVLVFEWVSECASEWVSELITEWVSYWVSDQGVSPYPFFHMHFLSYDVIQVSQIIL